MLDKVATKLKNQFTFMPSGNEEHKPSAFSQSIEVTCEAEEVLEVEPRENKMQTALNDAISQPVIDEVAK